MGNIFNDDFRDFISSLNRHHVEYILVGGYSVILHGYPRTTGDLDIWVRKSADNYLKLKKAFEEFGMATFDMTAQNFLNNPELDVFSFGRPPVSIDIMTAVKGLEFEHSFNKALSKSIEGMVVKLIHYDDLLTAKKAAGRSKDKNDIENLDKSND